MSSELPQLLPVAQIQERLLQIFPEGIPNRTYCTREIAARTVFVMLYIGAIEGRGRYLRPDQVTRMTDRQAARTDARSRNAWAQQSLRKSFAVPGRWYAANTREPIRDETLREGLVRTGSAVARTDLPTTSSLPRYALRESFGHLFDPALAGDSVERAIVEWQSANLSAGALARIQLVRKGAVAGAAGVLVAFPSGETRRMAHGPSSEISKAVIEEFAPRFLAQPGVIFLSESGSKVVARDEALAKAIQLDIPADRFLPDILLVDLGPREPLLVFVEVVATDGAITESRKSSFLTITRKAGFRDEQVAFVTAYLDRSRPAFRKTVSELAWDSFVWFASEPDHIIILREGRARGTARLSELV